MKIARYENEDKKGLGKALKRLKLSKDKYVVLPFDPNKDLTPEELEQWKKYQSIQDENAKKLMPIYYKQKEKDSIFSTKVNGFRESLKVSDDQLIKNDRSGQENNVKEKDDELER